MDLLDALYPDTARTYGPNNAKAHLPEPVAHRTIVPEDDGGPITFRWAFTRGMLQPRMSGYELAQFVLRHMPSILPFFNQHPRVYAEFRQMMLLLATSPREVIDRVVPWIRAVTREGPDDVVHMSLFDQTEQPSAPLYFLIGD